MDCRSFTKFLYVLLISTTSSCIVFKREHIWNTRSYLIIRSCFFHLHHINQINKFMPRKIRERVVNSLVTPILHYCNSLLRGTMDKNFIRLQLVPNAATKLIVRCASMSALLRYSETSTGFLYRSGSFQGPGIGPQSCQQL